MVGVSVAAGRVVSDEHVGVLLVADCGDRLCDGESSGVGEPAVDLTMQAGVRVAERHGARHAEGGR